MYEQTEKQVQREIISFWVSCYFLNGVHFSGGSLRYYLDSHWRPK